MDLTAADLNDIVEAVLLLYNLRPEQIFLNLSGGGLRNVYRFVKIHNNKVRLDCIMDNCWRHMITIDIVRNEHPIIVGALVSVLVGLES